MSTSLCTGVIRNVAARYIHNGSSVYGWFLDDSKAFDMVSHDLLFSKLLDRNLPLPVIRFLYQDQRIRVRWHSSLSDSFSVSNGVRQGGVLSPLFFTVYLGDLLSTLRVQGIGCDWDSLFAGAVCYADDLALLAPSPSALVRCFVLVNNLPVDMVLSLTSLSLS